MNVAVRRFSVSSSPSSLQLQLRFFSSSGSSSLLPSLLPSSLPFPAANCTSSRTIQSAFSVPSRAVKAKTTTAMQQRTNSNSNNSTGTTPIPDVEDFHVHHEEALSRAEGTYIDPATGFTVFTELTHLKRGRCCGNRCRHCPYGFERVPQVHANATSSWRRRRRRQAPEISGDETPTTSTSATSTPSQVQMPGVPTAKLRSGDKEKAQQLVRDILERAGKWNPDTDGDNAGNSPVRRNRRQTQTRNSNSDDEDESSVSDSSYSSSDSSSSSSTGSNTNTPRKTTAVTAPSTITVIEASTASTASVTSSSNSSNSNSNSNSRIARTTRKTKTRTILRTTKNVPYTRSGDAGTSQLGTGERRCKTDDAFTAMGTVDELCTFVGVAHSHLANVRDDRYGDLPERLLDVMSRLFDVGSHIAKPPPVVANNNDGEDDDDNSPPVFVPNGLGDGFAAHHVDDLEDWIHEWTEDLPELTSFVLPTGSPAAAALHVARTVCRRAERTVVPLAAAGICDPNAMRYLNRLSDVFFVAARWVNFRDGREEIEYRLAAPSSSPSCSVSRRDQRERVHRSLT